MVLSHLLGRQYLDFCKEKENKDQLSSRKKKKRMGLGDRVNKKDSNLGAGQELKMLFNNWGVEKKTNQTTAQHNTTQHNTASLYDVWAMLLIMITGSSLWATVTRMAGSVHESDGECEFYTSFLHHSKDKITSSRIIFIFTHVSVNYWALWKT